MAELRRVIVYVDGFNLYHAICNLGIDQNRKQIPGKNHLKWVDLWALSLRYANKPDQQLAAVKYFSAYATWLPGPYSRHRKFVTAIKSRGVEFIEGQFKNKDRFCRKCRTSWVAHEEKETDVNIGIHLLNDAYKDRFDQAFVVTADSDISPAIKMVRQNFSNKFVYILNPPKSIQSGELIRAAGGYAFSKQIKEGHIANALLPEKILDQAGNLIVERPVEYRS
jgi:hypothetical protein